MGTELIFFFFVFWRINSQVADNRRKLFLLLRLGFLPSLTTELELMLPLLAHSRAEAGRVGAEQAAVFSQQRNWTLCRL